MLRQALVLLTLLTVHAVAQPTSEPTPMAQAVAAIKLKPNWQRIEITEEKPTSYRLQLYYKPLGQRDSPVVSRAEATADTKEIAGAALDELKKEGKDPAKDRINLSAWAQQDAGKGMTGGAAARQTRRACDRYGSASLIGLRPCSEASPTSGRRGNASASSRDGGRYRCLLPDVRAGYNPVG